MSKQETANKCRCFIRHPAPGAEREAVAKNLDYFRSIGDTNGTMIAVAQLSGTCPAQKG